MKTYHIQVQEGDDGWLVAEATNLPGAVTQGKDLNELAYMVRDAIEMLTGETEFSIELAIHPDLRLTPAS